MKRQSLSFLAVLVVTGLLTSCGGGGGGGGGASFGGGDGGDGNQRFPEPTASTETPHPVGSSIPNFKTERLSGLELVDDGAGVNHIRLPHGSSIYYSDGTTYHCENPGGVCMIEFSGTPTPGRVDVGTIRRFIRPLFVRDVYAAPNVAHEGNRGFSTIRIVLDQIIPADDSAMEFPYVITGIQAADLVLQEDDEDGNSLTGTITIAAGSAVGTDQIRILDDARTEGDEVMNVAFGATMPENGGGAEMVIALHAGENPHPITIIDNDVPPTRAQDLVAAPLSIPEAGGTTTVTLTLDEEIPAGDPPLEFPYNIVGVAALDIADNNDDDDDNPLTGVITVLTGEITGEDIITIRDDGNVERGEFMDINLDADQYPVNGVGVTLQGETRVPRVVIADDDEPVVVAADGAESGTDGRFTITFTGAPSTSATVAYSMSGSGVRGTDYTLEAGDNVSSLTNGTFSVEVNASTGSEGVLIVRPLQDADIYDETVTLTVTGVTFEGLSSAAVEEDVSANLEINDDDEIYIGYAADPQRVSEASGAGIALTVNASGDGIVVEAGRLPTVSVVAALPSSGDAQADAVDFTDSDPVTFRVPAGTYGTAGTNVDAPALNVINDSIVEDEEAFALTFRDFTGPDGSFVAVGRQFGATGYIVDDDALANVRFAAAASEVAEGDTATITVEATGELARDVTVAFTISGADAADYTAPDPLTVTFPAASGSTHRATISIPTLDDEVSEGAETLTVTLVDSGADAGVYDLTSVTGGVEHVLTITDDDEAGVEVTATDGAESGTDGTFAVSFTDAPSAVATVSYELSGSDRGTAYTLEAGEGVSSLISDTFNVSADAAGVLVVSPLQDEDIYDETVTLTVTGVTFAGLSSAAVEEDVSANLEINDDDEIYIGYAADPQRVSEASGAGIALTVNASGDGIVVEAGREPTVSVVAALSSSGNARADADDFTDSDPVTFRVPAGTYGTAGTNVDAPALNVIDDSIVEDEEAFALTFRNFTQPDGSFVAVGRQFGATGYIIDDDALANVRFAAATSEVAEGDTAEITVEATGLLAREVAVAFTISGADADDYTAPNPLTVTIPAGSGSTHSATISIPTVGDEVSEGPEILTVTLVDSGDDADAYDLGTALTHALTITDDDSATAITSFTAEDAEISESATDLTTDFTITLDSPAPVGGVSIPFTTNTGAASGISGFDHTFGDVRLEDGTATVSSTQIVIPAGSTTGVFAVRVLNDDYEEGAETFTITLTPGAHDGVSVVVGENDTASVTILDNDSATATLTAAGAPVEPISISASGVAGTFTLALANAPDRTATVSYSFTSDDGAVFGTDYAVTVPRVLTGLTSLPSASGSFDIRASAIARQGVRGAVEVPITVTPQYDTTNEGNETVEFNVHSITFTDRRNASTIVQSVITADTGRRSGTASLTITEGVAPTATLTAGSQTGTDAIATEGDVDDKGVFTLTLINAPDAEATVTYTTEGRYTARLSGAGTSDPDLSGTFTIPAGTSEAEIIVTPADDDDIYDEEVSITVTEIDFGSGVLADIGSDLSAAITVDDDEVLYVRFDTSRNNGLPVVRESDGIGIRLTVSGGRVLPGKLPELTITAGIYFDEGLVEPFARNADFTGSGGAGVTMEIPAGLYPPSDTPYSGTHIDVPALNLRNDALVEGGEFFRLDGDNLSGPDGSRVVANPLWEDPFYYVLAYIEDDDVLTNVRFTAAASEVSEGDTASVTVEADGLLEYDVKVSFEHTTTGTSGDYESPPAFVTLTPSADAANQATISIPTIENATSNPASTITLTLLTAPELELTARREGEPDSRSRYALGEAATHALTLLDDETPPTSVSSLTIAPGTISEAGGDGNEATLTLTLDQAIPEGDTALVFPLGLGAGFTIDGNDDAPAGTISSDDIVVTDADGTVVTGIKVEPGSATGTVTIAAVQDDIDEGDSESDRIRLGTLPVNGHDVQLTIAEDVDNFADLTITDDDGSTGIPPTSIISITTTSDSTATETLSIAEDGGDITLTLTLDRVIPADDPAITFPYVISGAGITTADYTVSNPDGRTQRGIRVAPGSATGSIIITAVQDAEDEGDGETMTVALGTLPFNASSDRITVAEDVDQSVDITITDDDNPLEPTHVIFLYGVRPFLAEGGLDRSGSSPGEGFKTTSVVLVLNRPIPEGSPDLVFPLEITGIQEEDIVGGITGRTITVKKGTQGGEIIFTVVQDDINEGSHETMRVALVTPPDNANGNPIDIQDGRNNVFSKKIVILDDDSAGTPPTSVADFSASPTAIPEDGGTTTLTLRLDRAIPAGDFDLEFRYSITSTEARSDRSTQGFTADDITATGLSGTITVPKGSDTGTATITAVQDDIDEGVGEDMFIHLHTVFFSTPYNGDGIRVAVPDRTPARVTIVDDEETVPTAVNEFSSSKNTIRENGGSVTLTLRLDHPVPLNDPALEFPYAITDVNPPYSRVTASDIDVPLEGEIVVLPGSDVGTLTITAREDNIRDTFDFMLITLGTLPLNSADARLLPRIAHNSRTGWQETISRRVKIKDNERVAVVYIRSEPNDRQGVSEIHENGGRFTIKARTGGNYPVLPGDPPLRIPYAITGIQQADIDRPLSGDIVIQPGEYASALVIVAQDDDEAENETAVITLGPVPIGVEGNAVILSGTGAAPGGATLVRSVVINDEEATPSAVIAFTASPGVLAEGAATTLTLTLNQSIPADQNELVFDYAFEGRYPFSTHVHVDAEDFNPAGLTGSITVQPGSSTGTAVITTAQDDRDERTERFGVRLDEAGPLNADGFRVWSNLRIGEIEILDGGEGVSRPTRVRFPPATLYSARGSGDSEVTGDIIEAGGTARIRVQLNRLIPIGDPDLVFPWTITGAGITADDVVGGLSGEITVLAGSKEGYATITARQDDIDEGAGETMTVTFDPLPVNEDGLRLAGYEDERFRIFRYTLANEITITDDDPVRPQWVTRQEPTTDSIVEDGGTVSMTLLLNVPISGNDPALDFPYVISGHGITDADVVGGLEGVVTIPSGSDTGTLTLTALQDDVEEGGGEIMIVDFPFELMPRNAGGVQIGTSDIFRPLVDFPARITIVDDETTGTPPVRVTGFSATPSIISESAGYSTVRVEVNSPVPVNDPALVFPYVISGDGITEDDVRGGLTGSIRILPGAVSGTMTITARGDTEDEGLSETMTVTLDPLPANAAGDQITASGVVSPTITITDDDGPVPPRVVTAFSASAGSMTENGLTIITLNLNRYIPVDDPALSFPYTITGVDAGDITVPLSGDIVVEAGYATGTLDIGGVVDDLTEADEVMTVTLGALPSNSFGEPIAASGVAPIVIVLNDGSGSPTSVVRFDASPRHFSENGGTTTLTLTLDRTIPAGDGDLTFPYVIGGQGITSDDIEGSLNGNIIVEEGNRIGTATITGRDDDISEARLYFRYLWEEEYSPGEPLYVYLVNLPNNARGERIGASATSVELGLLDDDPPVLTRVSGDDVREPRYSTSDPYSGGVRVSLSRQLSASESVRVTYTLAAGGGATAADINEFSDLSGVKTLVYEGSRSGFKIPITAAHDTLDDDGETIIVTITGMTITDSESGESHVISLLPIAASNPVTVAVLDNDGPDGPEGPDGAEAPALLSTIATVNPDEADSSVGGVTLTLDRALAQGELLIVTYYLRPGDGGESGDINQRSAYVTTLRMRDSGDSVHIPVTAYDDGYDDAGETVRVTILSVSFVGVRGSLVNGEPISLQPLDSDGSVTLTIQDNDGGGVAAPPELLSGVSWKHPDEADPSKGDVTVNLSRGLVENEAVTVSYTLTAGGGATAADINEFSDLSGTKTVVHRYYTNIRIPITAAPDSDDDNGETITMTITGATFNDAAGDDHALDIAGLATNPVVLVIGVQRPTAVTSFSASTNPPTNPLTISENGGEATLMLTLNHPIPAGDPALTFRISHPHSIFGGAGHEEGNVITVQPGSATGTGTITARDNTYRNADGDVTATIYPYTHYSFLIRNADGISIATAGVEAVEIIIADDEADVLAVQGFTLQPGAILAVGRGVQTGFNHDGQQYTDPSSSSRLIVAVELTAPAERRTQFGVNLVPQGGDACIGLLHSGSLNCYTPQTAFTTFINVDAGASRGTVDVRVNVPPASAGNVAPTGLEAILDPRRTVLNSDVSVSQQVSLRITDDYIPAISGFTVLPGDISLGRGGFHDGGRNAVNPGPETVTAEVRLVSPATRPFDLTLGIEPSAGSYVCAAASGQDGYGPYELPCGATFEGITVRVNPGDDRVTARVKMNGLPESAFSEFPGVTSQPDHYEFTISLPRNGVSDGGADLTERVQVTMRPEPTRVTGFSASVTAIAEGRDVISPRRGNVDISPYNIEVLGGSTTLSLTLDRVIPEGGAVLYFPYTITGIQREDIRGYRLEGYIWVNSGSDTGTKIITALPDGIDEENIETMTITLGVPPRNAAGEPITMDEGIDPLQVDIIDEGSTGTPPTSVSISVDSATIREGESSTVTLTLDHAIPAGDPALLFPWTISGIQMEDLFFSRELSGSITIPPGSDTGSFRVEARQDHVDEDDSETVTFQLGDLPENAAGDQITASPASVDVTITDIDDYVPPTEVTAFTASPERIAENGGATTLTLTLNQAIPTRDSDLTFPYTISGVGITAADIVGGLSGEIVVRAGKRTGTALVTAILDDVDEDADEIMIFALGTLPENASDEEIGVNGNIGGSVEVTILESGSTGTPPTEVYGLYALAVGPYGEIDGSIEEDGGVVVLSLYLNHPIPAGDAPLIFPYTISGNGITADDITADSLSGSITVQPGDSEGEATITAAQDDVDEGRIETMVFQLGDFPRNATGAQITTYFPLSPSIEIYDDDDDIEYTLFSFSVTPNQVSLSRPDGHSPGSGPFTTDTTGSAEVVVEFLLEERVTSEEEFEIHATTERIASSSGTDDFCIGRSADTRLECVSTGKPFTFTLSPGERGASATFKLGVLPAALITQTEYTDPEMIVFDLLPRGSLVLNGVDTRGTVSVDIPSDDTTSSTAQSRLASRTRTLALATTVSQLKLARDMVRDRVGGTSEQDGIGLGSFPEEGDLEDVRSLMRASLSFQQSVTEESGARYSLWASSASGDLDAANAGLEWASSDGRSIHGVAMSASSASLSFAAGEAGLENSADWKWPSEWNEDMTLMTPYLTHKADQVELWAMSGFGVGEIRLDGGTAAAVAESQLVFAQAGAAWSKTFQPGLRLQLETHGVAARKDVGGYRLGIHDVPAVSADVFRMTGETSLSWPLSMAAGVLTPRAEADVSSDVGGVLPGRTRNTFDLTTGMSWTRGIFAVSLEGSRSLNGAEAVSEKLAGDLRLTPANALNLGLELATENTATAGQGNSNTEKTARFTLGWKF